MEGSSEMVVVLVHHYCKPGTLEQAIRRLDANGERMATFPGFLFRQRLSCEEQPLRLSTVTAWDEAKDYEHWLAVRRSGDPGPAFAGESPYERTVTELCNVDRVHEPPPG